MQSGSDMDTHEAMQTTRFLEGFAWPVLSAHRNFVPKGYFDNESLFHSNMEAYGTWKGRCHSLQVHRSLHVSSTSAARANHSGECVCSLFGPGQVLLASYVTTTNGVAIDLLKTGDVTAFLAAVGGAAMARELDKDGQPLAIHLHARRLIGRSADELIGICKGVLADGVLAQSEAEFLLRWMTANACYINQWPFDHLYARLASAMQDGRLDSSEEAELLQILSDMANPSFGPCGESSSNELLCDRPVPTVIIEQRSFVLTGKFVSGPRAELENMLKSKGGLVASAVSKKVNYLIIGAHGSRDWLMSTHGTKINTAAVLKREGHPIAVVAERHLVPHL